uniref:J domain-containing protein n=1 Tax=Triticum urartu TaxID=4572 RepID=A0A8R7V996_TRIUA
MSLRVPSSSAWPAVGRRRRASPSAAVRCGATREKRPAAAPGVGLEEDHYRTLRLAPGATRGEAKKAFHRLALQYHPDVVRQENSDTVGFERINAAYQRVMSNMQEAEGGSSTGAAATASPTRTSTATANTSTRRTRTTGSPTSETAPTRFLSHGRGSS